MAPLATACLRVQKDAPVLILLSLLIRVLCLMPVCARWRLSRIKIYPNSQINSGDTA